VSGYRRYAADAPRYRPSSLDGRPFGAPYPGGPGGPSAIVRSLSTTSMAAQPIMHNLQRQMGGDRMERQRAEATCRRIRAAR
jgi:hypothetical protein